MRGRWLPGWRAALVYTHRWLGAAGCALFLVWFASGIVMMYARMPALAPEERLARSEPLDLSTLTLGPADALRAAASPPGARLSIAMRDGRPIYRVSGSGARPGTAIVFGDNGDVVARVSVEEARRLARRFAPSYAGAVRDDGHLDEPDQWTLQARAQLPIYRFALDDAERTRIYVAERSGEVVLRTTSRERFWGYLGPVLHWIYFTPLRRNGGLWSDVVIWSSIAGCLVCVSGLAWGLVRFSPRRRFRLAGEHQRSPYTGSLRWHHYAGLLFGVITLTWTFSGLLSMGPWSFLSSPTLSERQRALGRTRANYDGITADDVRHAARVLAAELDVHELELIQVQASAYWLALQTPSTDALGPWLHAALGPRRPLPSLARRYVDARHWQRGAFSTFDEPTLLAVAATTMGDTSIEERTWLTAHDGYYYEPRGQRALPVLRIRYTDASRTWLYLDPQRGGVALANDRTTRTRRWLYQGLHSLDFPVLYDKRPLWDIVVIGLSLGGLAVGATVVTPSWRRWQRWRKKKRGRPAESVASEVDKVR